jgi:4'-phosphopantetheinyl transferase
MSMSVRPHEGRASSPRKDIAQRQEDGRPAAPAFPVLAEDECHVWAVELEQPAHVQAALAAHLSEDERQHMQALRLPALRSRYAVAHGALRVLLGRYLGMAPKLCRYATGPRGKPMLAAPCPGPAGRSAHEPGSRPGTGPALHFNMAHSGTQALVAVARGIEMGVDIELRRDMDDMAGVARSILSRADLGLWLALPEAQRPAAFYAIWTRKEAVSKAAGTGLYMDFPGLSVEFRPQRPAAVRRIDADFGKPEEWLLAELECAPGYSAALAARTPALRISRHTARIDDGAVADINSTAGTV